ncbi:cytochrome c-type biogenesis protein CcmH [Paracoccus bogoriensis]|uniref:cytochrome c-type biogenesis protein n=1 Tax=Paracoccus bogoriensis TaxID=242065 RepID=UPI001C663694|nr:cytochrome c-type biogenesis protein [Paracoccus bogoriensis]MBW7055792.1 cytochrome c-type biogenesis protein CcmH [Paracoccus bogoriensis]
MRRAVLHTLALALALALAPAAPVMAVQPDEVLEDADLESRARALSQKLRCPVCAGETIDESNAPISRDLRLYVRERLVAGDNDAEVLDNVADRFGEYVLFEPRAEGINWLLWLSAPLMGMIAIIVAWRFLASRAQARPEEPARLSEAERRRLDEIMRGN